MFCCIILSVGTIWYEWPWQASIIWGTWSVFFVDYVVRLWYAKDKWLFIRSNPFDLVALIPLDALYQSAKLARLFRVMRLKTMTKRFSNPLISTMKNTKRRTLVSSSLLLVFVSTLPFYYYEPIVKSYPEAFTWSIGTLFLFGNQDVDPASFIGKATAVILTILGVCIHALLVTTLTNVTQIFVKKKQKRKAKTKDAKEQTKSMS